MPTKNPRLTITIEPTLHAQLRRLSELTGNSQASLIADLLHGSQPVFSKLIDTLEAAERAQESMRGSVAQEMAAAQRKLEGQLGLQLDQESNAAPLLQGVEAVNRRRRRQLTPPSNRGVRSPRVGRISKGN